MRQIIPRHIKMIICPQTTTGTNIDIIILCSSKKKKRYFNNVKENKMYMEMRNKKRSDEKEQSKN